MLHNHHNVTVQVLTESNLGKELCLLEFWTYNLGMEEKFIKQVSRSTLFNSNQKKIWQTLQLVFLIPAGVLETLVELERRLEREEKCEKKLFLC